MAFLLHTQACPLYRLSDDILQLILDYAMARDSPFYISDPLLGVGRPYINSGSEYPRHDRALQPVHRKDWISLNSASRRLRPLAKLSFFSQKTFAIHRDLPERLQRNESSAIKGMMPHDQALALPYIRDIIIVNPTHASPTTFIALPHMLAAFPSVCRCTLLFQFTVRTSENVSNSPVTDVERITEAFIASNPLPLELQALMVGIGIPGHIILDEAFGLPYPREKQFLLNMREKNAYPILQVKAKLLQAKKEKEIQARSRDLLSSQS